MTEISLETLLVIIGLTSGGSITIQLWTLKRLNFTCTTITKIVTFLKLRYPNETKGILD